MASQDLGLKHRTLVRSQRMAWLVIEHGYHGQHQDLVKHASTMTSDS